MYSSKFCIYIFAGYSQGDRILHWWPRTWFQFLYSILLHWQNRGLTNAIWLLGQGSPNTFKRIITCVYFLYKECILKILTWCRPKKTGGSNYKPVDLHSPLDQTPKGKSWAKNTDYWGIQHCNIYLTASVCIGWRANNEVAVQVVKLDSWSVLLQMHRRRKVAQPWRIKLVPWKGQVCWPPPPK